MGKTTKKKKSRRLKRRIGLIAIGGLSMVLTVCLSVGATLAWFAGSTWASKDLFMGGPVYVEMAGRGQTDNVTDGSYAQWKGGNGQLDIIASKRSSGTKVETWSDGDSAGLDNVLLPGQKMLVYSQARVYSTAYTSNVGVDDTGLSSSGANVNNSNYTYTDSKGEKKTTTTSVLRARFSINVEFDPTVGFNNFTDAKYADNYPVQSTNYTGEVDKSGTLASTNNAWWLALGATPLASVDGTTITAGRRDAVTVYVSEAAKGDYAKQYIAEAAVCAADSNGQYQVTSVGAAAGNLTTFNTNKNALWAIQQGNTKSIYKWKYVSATQYEEAEDAVGETTPDYSKGIPMGEPFNGEWNTVGTASAEVEGGSGVGFYGIWECDDTGKPLESDAFYKVRTKEYLQSYKESYVDENDRMLILTIQNEMENLENALNKSFVKLVNESSDKIMSGYVNGFTATDEGLIGGREQSTAANTKCSWLYVDPKIGNDTNASDSATSTGGWWYLVESANTNSPTTADNAVVTQVDSVDPTTDGFNWSNVSSNTTNGASANFVRTGSDGLENSADKSILKAKLFEIKPEHAQTTIYTSNANVQKIVSVAFPFVNGMFELPGKELTNIFANAKISFQISFQALQAFFPWSPSIDGLPSGHQLAGLGKALNIENAIPIYNEAFNYLAFLSE